MLVSSTCRAHFSVVHSELVSFYAGGRMPKSLDKPLRPPLECTAVLAHGEGLFLYITDEDS